MEEQTPRRMKLTRPTLEQREAAEEGKDVKDRHIVLNPLSSFVHDAFPCVRAEIPNSHQLVF